MKTETQNPSGKFEGCTSLCPECGSDLYLLETGCVCKNPKCSWTCNKCKQDDQP